VPIEIQAINDTNKAQLTSFLNLPYSLYKGASAWHPPLRFERRLQISQDKNPNAYGLDRQLFIAKRGPKIIGRIAAFLNPQHRARYQDEAGHFGYFDCEADPATGAALLSAAEAWLRCKGAQKMIGPSNHSVNEESGLLIDGFEHPNVLMMPFGRPDYTEMVERAGFEKAVDLLAFQADLAAGFTPGPFMRRLRKIVDQDDGISFRTLDMSKFTQEVELAMRIFNDAWSENWGFVPLTDAQIAHTAKELKPIIFPDGYRLALIDGKPAAFIWMLPNINEAIRDLNGHILPFGWAKLIARLKLKKIKTARVPLMGLLKEHQNTKRGLAALCRICEDVFEAGTRQGFTHCELSWILEDNKGMQAICAQASAKVYKTYRMYEKALG
jgi:hypothetical protein